MSSKRKAKAASPRKASSKRKTSPDQRAKASSEPKAGGRRRDGVPRPKVRDNERVSFFPIPPDGFNPRTATAAELQHFGLPARPGRGASAVERQYWDRTFTGPITTAPPTMQMLVSNVAAADVPHHDHRINLAQTGGRHQRSENWSGGFVTPAGGGMFVQVRGLWRVPEPQLPSHAVKDEDYRSSVWIGLDGQRRYLHSSLPQIGTAQFIIDPTGKPVERHRFCWWQWWFRNGFSQDHRLSLQVDPDDLVSAEVTVLSRTSVKFFIMNVTKRKLYPVFQAWAPQSKYTDVTGLVQVMVSGATAEWVVERPRAYKLHDDNGGDQTRGGGGEVAEGGQLYRLPNYDVVEFSECHAIAKESPASVKLRVHRLVGGRYINMYERRRAPERTVDVSIASRVSDTSLKTTYRPS